jgi:hypothetical protein
VGGDPDARAVGLRPRWTWLRAAFALLVAVAITDGACSRPARAPLPAQIPPRARFSLLAVGDTGAPLPMIASAAPARQVGAALAEQHRLRAADAFVLLGDNFYPEGLRADEVETRVRENVVGTFCPFVVLSAALSPRVAGGCEGALVPLPLFALLGNHDYSTPESPLLQRELLPLYVANWHVPGGAFEVVDLAGGVSLVFYDPRLLREQGDFASLLEAVRAARGPWRILATHYPLADEQYGPTLLALFSDLEEIVHLHLAGHEHNLQIGALEAPLPRLQVVAGSGSEARGPRQRLAGARFYAERTGFVRVDLLDGPGGGRLLVSLLAVGGGEPRLAGEVVSRWSVDLAGHVRAEVLPGA